MPAYDKPITLLEARTLLHSYITPDLSDADGVFLRALNQAVERIQSDGIWEGEKEVVDVAPYVTNNILTLPYEYDNLMGIQVDKVPTPIFSENLEFMEGGPGASVAGEGGSNVIDLGFAPVSGQLLRSYKMQRAVGATTTLVGLCHKRFVYITADADEVNPANIGALKNALLAIHFEDEGDNERAEQNWARVNKILNSEKSITNIGSKKPIAFSTFPDGNKPTSMY